MGGNAFAILRAFQDILVRGKKSSLHADGFAGIEIPKFEESMLIKLCQDSAALLRRWPTVIEIDAPVHILGDINGNIFDVIRVISKCGSFSTTRYVFLGNYIARGAFSVQVMALLLGMFCLCPQNVVLLRGANEFDETSEACAFEQELREDYGAETKLHEMFQEVFALLPLGCLINKDILCVHGGITRRIKTVVQIASVKRPSYTVSDAVLSDIVSANPNPAPGEYLDSQSTGESCNLRQFLEANELRKIIRGHEFVPKGVAVSAGGKVLTVFSCSNFEGKKNRAGVIRITEDHESRGTAIPGLPSIPRRENAVYSNVSPPKKEAPANPRVFRQGQLSRGIRRKPNPVFSNLVTQARRGSSVVVKGHLNVSRSMDTGVETSRIPDLSGQEDDDFPGMRPGSG